MGIFNRAADKVKSSFEGDGFGKPTRYHWTDRSRNLPSGGAQAFSFDTLQLPTYTPVGWGIIAYKDYRYFSPQVGVSLAVIPNSLGNPGNLTGQMVNAPLISRTSRNPDGGIPAPSSVAFDNRIVPGALS